VSPSTLVAIEFALVIGIVLGLGIWQLVSVRREIARERERASRRPPAGDAIPPATGDDTGVRTPDGGA